LTVGVHELDMGRRGALRYWLLVNLRANAAFLLSTMLIALVWWWPNRATEAGFPAHKLDSVSFAPYRIGQSPISGIFPTKLQVAEDIALLAPHVRAIRTYAALGGPAASDVPALAGAHGLKVWQGIWLGDNAADNARDIAAGIALANRYPDVIERVIVGNEVLLRHDLPPKSLIADIDAVRAAVRQPVAYADVWQDWQRYPQVAPHVDEILVHLLPFWEDQPLGIDRAVAQELDYYRQIQTLFPGKPVIVGETGWPSLGRWRADAAPGRVNEARYLREFTAAAQRQDIEYNLIEAFDQDWKAAQEGTVGAAWGIWTVDRQPKFPPGVAVRDDPAWAWHAGGSVLLGALLFAVGWRRPANALLAVALGAALVWAWAETLSAALGQDWLMEAAVNLAGQALMAWALAARSPQRRLLAVLEAVFLVGALAMQILLLVDPRYRDFPTAAFAVPLVGAVWRFASREPNRPEALIAVGLGVVAIAGAMQEGAANRQSLIWCGAALLLAAPPLMSLAASRLTRAALPAAGPGG
jgi:exo-beta-1,3-glucanase (GH17 family)